MDQSRYEPVPKKEGKAGKAFKNFGKYIKAVFKSIIESFQYNKMKLPAILLAIGGVMIGLFLGTHAQVVKQLTYSYATVENTADGLQKVTHLFGIPYDYTGIVIFVLMLLGILNIFMALNFANKQNLGSVVSALVVTIVMAGLTFAYFYAINVFKGAVTAGKVPGTDIPFEVADLDVAKFTAQSMKSLIIIFIADGLSLIACILGFIHHNPAYEKVVER